MSISARKIEQYHVFLASPGDVNNEREQVRKFFERFNRHTAQLWNVRFEVVDWENYSTIGVGRPQRLITRQTLENYHESLALVIGIMAQRFGSPTGEAESGTEEEFNWAMESHKTRGFPEIKWFFRKIDTLEEIPSDPEKALEAIEQWKKVLEFRKRMRNQDNPVFYTEYVGQSGFRDVFENDLKLWLSDTSRPWVPKQTDKDKTSITTLSPPRKYYENIERDFRRLDISGIDNDRAFEIPLSEIYVRLRVMFDEDTDEETEAHESGAIDIQTALLRYPKLVIVGDPGCGKSTFLKYIALITARSFLSDNYNIALEKLCLSYPLPIPIFLSCWDLADFLKEQKQSNLNPLPNFIAERLDAYEFSIPVNEVEKLIESGGCFLLFDGLDEVPTEAGRATISRLLDDFVIKYGKNRFAVTSRVRAYTGGAILKGEFTRCDIQPFNADERAKFIRNWVALLFKVVPENVDMERGEAAREFKGLSQGIETNERIRPLAINPLLLTVIAIVHWNRKRLPEQRVDLYDECVDVLLGQRKEAERVQLSPNTASLDEKLEEKRHENRSWVRKRFAEIALRILSQDGDHEEASKADIVKLLTPRFIDQGASDQERAAARAELFLERQELRSGLLVSRRARSYRFAHLTFQEYLTAWQLSNMDFEKVTKIIQPRLRVAKWFETLQLLGAQWAKESDDKADLYIEWLLDNQGHTIKEQAPVVALCANVVKDISGVAELKPETRSAFEKAVEATLDVFKTGSGVDTKTQLEIIEALGQLGGMVKSHLIDATKAGKFQVRRRAIEMLLPHLSDDELFSSDHILKDRSKEPIKSYLLALFDRDEERVIAWLRNKSDFNGTCASAVLALPCIVERIPSTMKRMLMEKRLVNEQNYDTRLLAAKTLIDAFPDAKTRKILEERAVGDSNDYVRIQAIKLLSDNWTDDATRNFLEELAGGYCNNHVRIQAIKLLSDNWPDNWADEKTRKILEEQAVGDSGDYVRSQALKLLSDKWSDDVTRKILEELAVGDSGGGYVRSQAIKLLLDNWPDEKTRKILEKRAVGDSDDSVRIQAIKLLSDKWPDEKTRKIFEELAVGDSNDYVRIQAIKLLSDKWPDEKTRKLFAERIVIEVINRNPFLRALWALCVALGKMHSRFGQILFSRDLDGQFPYVDAREAISRKRIARAAENAGVSAENLDATVLSLSKHMGWDITKGIKGTA